MSLFESEFLLKLERLHLAARSLFTGRHQALSPSRRVGEGMEFADHREHVPGDDLRRLDWPLYARTGKLFTKLFHTEEDRAVYLLLDVSSSMTEAPRKFDYVRRLAAALGYITLANLDRFTLVPFAARAHSDLRNLRGKRQVHRLLAFLEALGGEKRSRTRLREVARDFVSRYRERGPVFVVSDFMDEAGLEGLDPITGRKFDLSMLNVFTPEEADPPWRGSITLEDVETGTHRRTRVTRSVRKEYEREWNAHLHDLRSYAMRRQALYAEARTDRPLEELVLHSLRRVGVLV